MVKVLAENYWQNSRVGNIEIYLLRPIILIFAEKIIFCDCFVLWRPVEFLRIAMALLCSSAILGRTIHCIANSPRCESMLPLKQMLLIPSACLTQHASSILSEYSSKKQFWDLKFEVFYMHCGVIDW